jgi:tetratricopeptide (TPR) repeat protein
MWEHAYRILFGTPPRVVRTIVAAVVGVHLVYFVALPWLLTRRKTRSPGLRRYLEWVVATPSLLGDVIRAEARHNLMRLAHMEGLHEQAAAQGFAIVRHGYLPAAMIAEVRGRLADALEGLGRFDEAREQRRMGEMNLNSAARDPAWYITRGRQLAARRDFVGACRAYEQGLEIAPPGANDARALLTLHLANTLFMAGRLEESAERAEEAAGLVADPERRLSAHRQAGAAYSDLGRLGEAEAHKRRAVAAAKELGDPERLANCMADFGEIRRKRGQLAEALTACDHAAAAWRPTRHIELIRYEILRSLGRFDEAMAAIGRAGQLDPYTTVRTEQMTQGIFAFARATILMEQGRLDDAATWLDGARAGVRGDAKLTLWCDAASTRLAALQGRRDEALRALDDVEPRLDGFAQDRNTRSGVLGNLGRAALALGEYDRALGYWEQYLALPPQPVDLPTAYYHLGECRRGLGDHAAARAAYREAVAPGLDTHYARLAQSRLRAIPA